MNFKQVVNFRCFLHEILILVTCPFARSAKNHLWREAIDYIHTNLHYIHRDIKPDNIVFDIDGAPTNSDFGDGGAWKA